MTTEERIADLHMHTVFSDGMDTPEQVVEKSLEVKLSCIAITDHDTIDGVKPTQKAAEGTSLEVLSGLELSTSLNKKDVHMLAYLYDHDNDELNTYLEGVQSARLERMKKMVTRLGELGVKDITIEDVQQEAGEKTLGRPHLAAVMVNKGVVSSIQQAFDKFLADNAPAFVAEFTLNPIEGIKLIRRAGGVPVLAHPMLTSVDELIPEMVEAGLKGIEAIYPNNSQTIVDFYKNLAEKHGLIVTGGSDAHGSRKKHTYIGKVRIPYSLVEGLKAAKE